MPPRKAAGSGDGADNNGDTKAYPQPTPQESYLFYTLLKHMKDKPEIDWEGVARDNNFKNSDTAKVIKHIALLPFPLHISFPSSSSLPILCYYGTNSL